MFQPGLVHTPVTPFTRERRIDFDLYREARSSSISQPAPTPGAADARGRIGEPHRRRAARAA